jgi:hypothetical protein
MVYFYTETSPLIVNYQNSLFVLLSPNLTWLLLKKENEGNQPQSDYKF